MAFFGDIGARDEPRGPIWAPFAVIRDNVERLVAINIVWFLQLLPGILALAFPQLPTWLRIALGAYSATAAIPATGVLYALAIAASRGEHLSAELTRQYLRDVAVPSLRKLTPLYGVFGALVWLVVLLGRDVPSVTTVATLVALLWYLCAGYWGPLLATDPRAPVSFLVKQSIGLVWHYPGETLATASVAAFALVIGFVSIGGLVLIVPVVVALLHTWRYLDLVERERRSRVQEEVGVGSPGA
ncbi:MAG TPA: hypothetical protein VKB09_02855 [Thermomicrobiales bacterium]|nr:hypothetical protein [Thermomicrobiales bacterium]